MTDLALYSLPEESVTTLTGPVSSTSTASSSTSTAPKRSAWAFMFIIRSGPMMPSGKPGKFSTSVVFISAPPASTAPVSTSGSSEARAA